MYTIHSYFNVINNLNLPKMCMKLIHDHIIIIIKLQQFIILKHYFHTTLVAFDQQILISGNNLRVHVRWIRIYYMNLGGSVKKARAINCD